MKLLSRDTIEPKQARAVPYNTRRPITASARKINIRDREEVQERATQQTATAEWQNRAWTHYDKIGEIKFAFGLVASVMSRVRLFPAFVVDPEDPPVRLTDAVTIERPEEEGTEDPSAYRKADDGIDPDIAVQTRDLFNKAMGTADVPSIMRNFALNANVPGECLLAFIDGRWQLKSTSELQIRQDGPKLFRTAGGGIPRDLDKDTPIGRVWREHPRYSFEADSTMKGVSDDCDELILLGRVIRSNSRARLNAGIAFIADEVSALSRTETDDPEVVEDEESSLEQELMEAIAATVEHEDAANTVSPIFLRGPADIGEHAIRHITFDRPIDEFLVDRADRTLERILQGIDVPKDTVTGLANVKYSNAVQIDESLYKAHVEPLCLMACDAITDIIFRPLLRAAGIDPEIVSQMVVWYDPSEVTTRPDRAADAQRLYDAHELSGAALRAAYGFSDTDKPSEQELAIRLAMANTPPEDVLNILLQQVFPKILRQTAAAEGAPGELPNDLAGMLSGEGVVPPSPDIEPTIGE